MVDRGPGRIRLSPPDRALVLELLYQERERLAAEGARKPSIYDRLVPSAETNAASLSQSPLQQRLEQIDRLILRMENMRA